MNVCCSKTFAVYKEMKYQEQSECFKNYQVDSKYSS